jgi:hypothetical protein
MNSMTNETVQLRMIDAKVIAQCRQQYQMTGDTVDIVIGQDADPLTVHNGMSQALNRRLDVSKAIG